MNIEEMQPGREMDARIAEDVMGWDVLRYDNGTIIIIEQDEDGYFPWQIDADEPVDKAFWWSPSSDIKHAWDLVKRMIGIPHSYEFYLSQQTDGWDVSFQHPGDKGGRAHGKTAPLAICLAALKVVE